MDGFRAMSILDEFDPHVTSTSTADIRKRRREKNIKANAMKNPGKYTVRDDKGLVIAFGTARQCIERLRYQIVKEVRKTKSCFVCKKSFDVKGNVKTCSPECRKEMRRQLRKFEHNKRKNEANLERYHRTKEATREARNEKQRARRQAMKEAKANEIQPTKTP